MTTLNRAEPCLGKEGQHALDGGALPVPRGVKNKVKVAREEKRAQPWLGRNAAGKQAEAGCRR